MREDTVTRYPLTILLALVSALLVVASLPPSASAADDQTVVVQAQVLASMSSQVSGAMATDYLLQVEEVLAGFVPGSAVLVRASKELASRAPIKPKGADVVVWLAPLADGTYRLLDMLDPEELDATSQAVSAPSSQRGYQSRACGFDMDNDGVFGEASDDCNVCDGVTADPDGDGVAEDINYIDASTGVDDVNCGAAGDPCATLDWVLDANNSSYSKRVDGASSDPEDIICVKGTVVLTTEDDALDIDGASTSHTAAYYSTDLAQWGSGGNSYFEYPSDPFMIVGWDADNDGSYPPHDTDDTATLTCDQGGGTYTTRPFEVSASYMEIAHLKIEKCAYDKSDETPAGAFEWDGAGHSHFWMHDVHLYQILYSADNFGNHIVFRGFKWNNNTWMAFENLYLQEVGAYVFRGGPSYADDIKIEYLTVQHYCETDDPVAWHNSCTFLRTWSNMNRTSVSYNDVDYDPSSWYGSGDASPGTGIAPSKCNQNFWGRGNLIKNYGFGISIRPNSDYTETCGTPQPMSGILFEKNLVWVDETSKNPDTHDLVRITNEYGSPASTDYLKDLKFYNNMVVSTLSDAMYYQVGLFAEGGGSDTTDFTGTYEFVGNTFWADWNSTAENISFEDNFTYNADVVWKNNIVKGDATNIRFDFQDSNFTGGNNVYDGTQDYIWQGVAKTTIGDWNTSSGDTGVECDPSLVDTANGDAHLLASDTCARDQGSDVSAYFTTDFDGDPRPQGAGWDIGADEVTDSGGNTTPSVTITAPAQGSNFPEGSSIDFLGTAIDVEDGDLTSNLTWTSSVDGNLGSGGAFSTGLSVGSHVINAQATDSGELTGADAVTVTVLPNNAPNVTITSPEENPALGRPVTSSGNEFPGAESEKVVDGALDIPDSAWAAQGSPNWVEIDLGQVRTLDLISVAPFIGSPGSNYYYNNAWTVQFRDALNNLKDFTNVIKLQGAGALAGPGITVTNGDPGTGGSEDPFKYYEFSFEPIALRFLRFTVTDGDVDDDSNGAETAVHEVFPRGEPITFSATANDPEDGNLTSDIVWSSNLDGYIGTGGSVSSSSLSVGNHTIQAQVTDSAGLESSHNIDITVILRPTVIFMDGLESGDTSAWSS